MTAVDLLALKPIQHGVGTISPGQNFRAGPIFAEQVLATGHAVRQDTRFVWDKVQWPGSHVVCIASGPSLTPEDCAAVGRWRAVEFDGGRRHVVVVNTSFKVAPWADILYAADSVWWDRFHVQVANEFGGRRFTCVPMGDPMPKQVADYALEYILLERGSGLNRMPSRINSGGNGGYQAVGLAYLAGAVRITLLGYDMRSGTSRRQHWHSEYAWWNEKVDRPFADWIGRFSALHGDLAKMGVTLVNASRESALKIPHVSLEEALGD